jgi:hypothetical protein
MEPFLVSIMGNIYDISRFIRDKPSHRMIITREKESNKYVKYICPNFFKRKIPHHFVYIPNDPYCVNYMSKQKDMTFISRRSNSDPEKSISITYKNNGELYHFKIYDIDEEWYAKWEDNGKAIDIHYKNLQDVIKNTVIKDGYTSI